VAIGRRRLEVPASVAFPENAETLAHPHPDPLGIGERCLQRVRAEAGRAVDPHGRPPLRKHVDAVAGADQELVAHRQHLPRGGVDAVDALRLQAPRPGRRRGQPVDAVRSREVGDSAKAREVVEQAADAGALVEQRDRGDQIDARQHPVAGEPEGSLMVGEDAGECGVGQPGGGVEDVVDGAVGAKQQHPILPGGDDDAAVQQEIAAREPLAARPAGGRRLERPLIAADVQLEEPLAGGGREQLAAPQRDQQRERIGGEPRPARKQLQRVAGELAQPVGCRDIEIVPHAEARAETRPAGRLGQHLQMLAVPRRDQPLGHEDEAVARQMNGAHVAEVLLRRRQQPDQRVVLEQTAGIGSEVAQLRRSAYRHGPRGVDRDGEDGGVVADGGRVPPGAVERHQAAQVPDIQHPVRPLRHRKILHAGPVLVRQIGADQRKAMLAGGGRL
jgi:hypothetical protein